MSDPVKNSALIKKMYGSFGFSFCGISAAGYLEEQAPKLEKWLNQGFQGEMGYLENYFDKRLDPRLLLPGAKSVISLLFNYFPPNKQENDNYKIAKYAYGEDYHMVVKEKCRLLLEAIRENTGDIEARVFVDSAPIMERVWAEKSGVGWIGKNGLLINKNQGSYFFLAEIVTDLDCEPDGPIKDYCGSCNKCVESCPTEAILPDKTLNASRCISYLTIELKNDIPTEFEGKMKDWIFGCDICQDVCPWNRFSKPHRETKFQPDTGILEMKREEWQAISEDTFNRMFSKSALKRTGWKGIQRNVKFIKGE